MNRNAALIGDIRTRLSSSEWFGHLRRRIGEVRVEVAGASLEARALLLTVLREQLDRPVAAVLPGDASLEEFESALKLFHPDPERIAIYPNPSLSPYQEVAPSLG